MMRDRNDDQISTLTPHEDVQHQNDETDNTTTGAVLRSIRAGGAEWRGVAQGRQTDLKEEIEHGVSKKRAGSCKVRGVVEVLKVVVVDRAAGQAARLNSDAVVEALAMASSSRDLPTTLMYAGFQGPTRQPGSQASLPHM